MEWNYFNVLAWKSIVSFLNMFVHCVHFCEMFANSLDSITFVKASDCNHAKHTWIWSTCTAFLCVFFILLLLLIISGWFTLHACLISYWNIYNNIKKNEGTLQANARARLFCDFLQFRMKEGINFSRFHVNFISTICLSTSCIAFMRLYLCVCLKYDFGCIFEKRLFQRYWASLQDNEILWFAKKIFRYTLVFFTYY